MATLAKLREPAKPAKSYKLSKQSSIMGKVTPVLIAALVCVTLPSAVIVPAHAQATSAAIGFDQLDIFVGTWNCNGKAFASGVVPTPITTGHLQVEKAVADQWLHIHYDENSSATNQDPLHLGKYMGYDAVTQKFLIVSVDNFGDYATETSAGWKGKAITFEGTIISDGKSAGIRETYTKSAPGVITHTAEARGSGGQWVKTDEESCRKSS